MRPIDADALAKRVQYLIRLRTYDAFNCLNEIDAAPTVDAVPVVHGRWVLGHVEPGYCTPGGNRPWVCSECGEVISWRLDKPGYNYCPNCGAKMDLEETY